MRLHITTDTANTQFGTSGLNLDGGVSICVCAQATTNATITWGSASGFVSCGLPSSSVVSTGGACLGSLTFAANDVGFIDFTIARNSGSGSFDYTFTLDASAAPKFACTTDTSDSEYNLKGACDFGYINAITPNIVEIIKGVS